MSDEKVHALLSEPEMLPKEGSEIEGVIDMTATGLDNVLRPVFINQEGQDFMQLTVDDARRMLEFLTEAIPYLEQQIGMTRQ